MYIKKCLFDAEQQFAQELKKMVETTADSTEFIAKANELKNLIKVKLEPLVDGSILDDADMRGELSATESHMNSHVASHVQVVDWKRQKEEAAAQTEATNRKMEELQGEIEEQKKKNAEGPAADPLDFLIPFAPFLAIGKLIKTVLK